METVELSERKPFFVENVRDHHESLIIRDDERVESYKIEQITNRIIHGDALNILKKIDAESFDIVFIDPPYFLQLPKKKLLRWEVKTVVDGVDDAWDKFGSFEEYDLFITNLLSAVKRVMKKNATIWVIATYHSVFRIGKIMQDLGFWLLNDIIWFKTNPMPNWLGVRFTNATETLIWAVKDKNAKKYTFDKNYAKEFGLGKVGANVWQIPICSGKERLKDEKDKKVHSTQKPIELLKRVILTSSKEGDLILDPTAGVGTTGYVAKALNRNFVMIEVNDDYISAMKKRFKMPLRIKNTLKFVNR